jgi:dolichol-phosphate mannosyltransferase
MVYVIFPAYNEERVIGPTLRALAEAVQGHEADYHAVLVDDGSTDRTVECAREAIGDAQGPALTVLRHERNLGLGAGLRTGIYWCVDRGSESDVIVTLDADNTQPPSLIPTLVAGVRAGHDLVIASRYRSGSEVHGVPWYRRLLSDGGRFVCQVIYPIPGVRDYTCCFRAFGMPILRRARAVYGDDLCTARGFEAVIDLLLRLGALDVKATEVGFVLNYGERVGQSKMKVLRTIRQTVKLLARRRMETLLPSAPRGLAAGKPPVTDRRLP